MVLKNKYVPQPRFTVAILNWHGGYQLFLDHKVVEAIDIHEESASVVHSEILNIAAEHMQKAGSPSTSVSEKPEGTIPITRVGRGEEGRDSPHDQGHNFAQALMMWRS
jgi:hypothetical protein